MRINSSLTPDSLQPKVKRLLELSGEKIRLLDRSWDFAQGTPVFTAQGKYTSRGWTEWTLGFMYGSALLQFDATDDAWFLEYGRRNTLERMTKYISHVGVHDHGFNIVSTYGNLLRLWREGRLGASEADKDVCELALKVSGAVQAARWTQLGDGRGFIHSFNGPHSLFVDTMRSLRSLALAHQLGHALLGEGDERISLLERLVHHASVTAEFSVYYGEDRDSYDVRGRVAHEAIFNVNNGTYRCPNSQQGYSPFTTWTRGLAWMMCGAAEQLEFLTMVSDANLDPLGGREKIEAILLRAAEAACDYYIMQTPQDGIPFWDTGAPMLANLGDYLGRPSDPFNDREPVDSSAAAIAAQGLWRLGTYLATWRKRPADGKRYRQAALTVVAALFDEPYLSIDPSHQGLILHSVYHRPNGWDYVPPGRKIPCGESSMWGDYHARELALLLHREIRSEPYLAFFNI
ncbi:MAG: glycoside hydrolase family 88 protein [Acidobacteria bacterium]|nr:glycoside hydrolase family 88 protein [Acidobacteriota bacterium]